VHTCKVVASMVVVDIPAARTVAVDSQVDDMVVVLVAEDKAVVGMVVVGMVVEDMVAVDTVAADIVAGDMTVQRTAAVDTVAGEDSLDIQVVIPKAQDMARVMRYMEVAGQKLKNKFTCIIYTFPTWIILPI